MKKFLSVMLAFLTVLSVVPAAVFADSSLGFELDEHGVAQIGTAEELLAFASDPTWSDGNSTNNYSAVLTDDIVITGSWKPFRFSNATFDGDGHTITFTGWEHTVANGVRSTYIGFIEYLRNATVTNLNIDFNISVTNSYESYMVYVGALAAKLMGNTNNIENVNCKVDIGINNSEGCHSYVGGLIGHGEDSIAVIKNCTVSGKINAGTQTTGSDARVGGLIGYSSGDGLTIENCTSSVDIISSGYKVNYAGGLVGYAQASSGNIAVSNSAASGNVSADAVNEALAGGLIGFAQASSGDIAVTNSAASGVVSAEAELNYAQAGGLIGVASANVKTITVDNCMASVNVSAATKSVDSGYRKFQVGGLIGSINASNSGKIDVLNCSSTGAVKADGLKGSYTDRTGYAGGLVGYANNSATIQIINCYSLSDITSAEYVNLSVGGIIGYDTRTIINNCYYYGDIDYKEESSSGSPLGTKNIGGIVGWYTNNSNYINCYSNVTVHGDRAFSGTAISKTDNALMVGDESLVKTLNENIKAITGISNLTTLYNNPNGCPVFHIYEEFIISQPAADNLTVEVSQFNGVVPTYQWYKVDGAAETALDGETSDTLAGTYDEDMSVRCKITYVNNVLGINQTLTTNVVEYVAPERIIAIINKTPSNGECKFVINGDYNIDSYSWMVWEPSGDTENTAGDWKEIAKKDTLVGTPSMYDNGTFESNGNKDEVREMSVKFKGLKSGDSFDIKAEIDNASESEAGEPLPFRGELEFVITDAAGEKVYGMPLKVTKDEDTYIRLECVLPIMKDGDYTLTVVHENTSGISDASMWVAAGRWVTIDCATSDTFVTDDPSFNDRTIRCAATMEDGVVVYTSPANYINLLTLEPEGDLSTEIPTEDGESKITVESGENTIAVSDKIRIPEGVSEAELKNAAKSVKVCDEIHSTAKEEAENIVANISDAKKSEIKNELKAENDENIHYVIQHYMDVVVMKIEINGDTKVLSLDITPRYNIVATTAEYAEDIDESNSVNVSEKNPMTVTEEVEIEIIVPEVFEKDTNLWVEHIKGNGERFYYRAHKTGNKAKFSNRHGFSLFNLINANPDAVQIENEAEAEVEEMYGDLDTAVKYVENGQTIVVNDGNEESVTVSREVSFTIKGDFNGTITAGDGYEVTVNKTEDGYTYTVTAVSAVPPTMVPLFFGTTVRVYDAANGTITPNGMPMIIGGMTKTFKFIPDDGYAVADVIVNGESYGAVEALTLDGFCGYVKLTAVFEKIEP